MKWTSLAAACALIALATRGRAAERIWDIKNVTIPRVLDKIQTAKGGKLQVPPELTEARLRIGGFGYPKDRYYVGIVDLLDAYEYGRFITIASFHQTVEVWQLDGDMGGHLLRFRGRCTLSFPRRGRHPVIHAIKDAIEWIVERTILETEETIVREFIADQEFKVRQMRSLGIEPD